MRFRPLWNNLKIFTEQLNKIARENYNPPYQNLRENYEGTLKIGSIIFKYPTGVSFVVYYLRHGKFLVKREIHGQRFPDHDVHNSKPVDFNSKFSSFPKKTSKTS